MRAKVVYDSFKYGPSKANRKVNDMERCLIKVEASRAFESCKNPALEAFISNVSERRWIDLILDFWAQIFLRP